MKILKYSLICFTLLTGASSCEKDGPVPLTDTRPPIELIVSNSTEFRPSYTVRTIRSVGTFTINLEIPASSGRSIKEITKVVAATGPSKLLGVGADPDYINAPIPGSGNKASFSSTLTEYTAITKRNVPANIPKINAVELTAQFYFLVTLDDNSTIISEPVRVLVIQD